MSFKCSPYDRSHLLTLEHPLFVKDLERFFWGAYLSDTESGDSTMSALKEQNKLVSAEITANEAGTFAGGPLLKWFLSRVNSSIQVDVLLGDGDEFLTGISLIHLVGQADCLLKAERTLLNVLQRLCGISTQTRQFVRAAAPCEVAATRKTLYGLLDKYAVSIGGGLTHRLNLGDAMLFKENHFFICKNEIEDILNSLKALPPDIAFATCEIEHPEQAQIILENLSFPLLCPLILLFDNFAPDSLERLIASLEKPPTVYFEASGGIHLDNISDYSKTGVDVLSIGALTHSVRPIDLSMRFTNH